MLMDTDQAALCMEALGNATRLAAFRLLVEAGPDGLPVGTLQERLAVPASTLSHHLTRLMRVGLLTQERQSRHLICRANYRTMNSLVGFLTRNCCVGAGIETTGVGATCAPAA